VVGIDFLCGPRKKGTQSVDPVVWKDAKSSSTQPRTIDQTCVGEFVSDHDITLSDKGSYRSNGRRVATGERQGGLGSEIAGALYFELAVIVNRPTTD